MIFFLANYITCRSDLVEETNNNNSFQHSLTYMKNEAETIRPMASMKIARVGYHVTGTGLVIAAAFEPFNSISKKKKQKKKRNYVNQFNSRLLK